MSGRRCGDLGERCKCSQRLQLDLACGPRCRAARPYPPHGQTPASRHDWVDRLAEFDWPSLYGVSCRTSGRAGDGISRRMGTDVTVCS